MSATISSKDVMALRSKTGMGMMECKKALEEAGGNMESAIKILMAAAKGKMDLRADRAAVEGAIAIAKSADSKSAAIVELDSETDFVARGDQFISAVQKIADIVLTGPTGSTQPTPAITAIVDELRVTTKENISVAHAHKLSAGKVGSYLHHNRQVAALVSVDGDAPDELLTGICQHIAAFVPTPLAVDESGLPAAEVEAAKNGFIEEAKASGKPAEIAAKMSIGKLKKWIDERTLLGQPYVRDVTGKTLVRDTLPKGTTVKSFVRLQVGIK
jgi:elongation factor Ts